MKKESSREPRTPSNRPATPDVPVIVGTGNGPARRRKKELSGWLSSIVAHLAVLAVIGLLLAPADFGGKDTLVVLLDLNHAEEHEIAILESAFTADDRLSWSDASAPQATGVDLFGAARTDAKGGQTQLAPNMQWDAAANLGAAGRPSAPRGSFFGIEATGHEFVYVLDKSGSMSGRRFHRATAELVRSIDALRKDQAFYVILFDSKTSQMFGSSLLRPRSVPATWENKAKLAEWLQEAHGSGGTNPRESLRVAIRMNPSAIFMLSDGEFDGTKKNNKPKPDMVKGNSDAFSIVAAASTKPPIHAIAFEDANSCENMNRLAKMTDGEYRFVKSQRIESLDVALKVAQAALQRDDLATAQIMLRATKTGLANTPEGKKLRLQYALTVFGSARDALETSDVETIGDSLLAIMEMDPNREVSGGFQETLATALIDHLGQSQSSEAAGEENMASPILADILRRFPRSKLSKRFADPLAQARFDTVRQLHANGKLLAAHATLKELLANPHSKEIAEGADGLQEQIREELFVKARQLQRSASQVQYAQYLHNLAAAMAGTEFQILPETVLEEMAMELLVSARDGNLSGDQVAKNKAYRILNDGFRGSPVLSRVRKAFNLRELQSRGLYRSGNRLERSRKPDAAAEKYRLVVSKFPRSQGAQMASLRLRELGQNVPTSGKARRANSPPLQWMQGPRLEYWDRYFAANKRD